MEINETDYILGTWFAENREGDWLLTVLKRNNEWLGQYRFRYKKDNKVWNSEDIKSFYTFKIPGTVSEEEIENKMNQLFEVIKIKYPKGKYVQIKGNTEKFMFKLAQEDFCHIDTLQKEENRRKKND